MRVSVFIIVLIGFASCTNSGGEEDRTTVSTVDSNTVGTADSVPPILYLDDPKLDSFPMAMDSAGPTIEPQDTQYKKAVAR